MDKKLTINKGGWHEFANVVFCKYFLSRTIDQGWIWDQYLFARTRIGPLMTEWYSFHHLLVLNNPLGNNIVDQPVGTGLSYTSEQLLRSLPEVHFYVHV